MDLLVKRHFMLESNWREGRYLSFGNYDINGLHRIQLDEVEGTILSTHTAGMETCVSRDYVALFMAFAGTVRSNCMQLREPIWTEVRPNAHPLSHTHGALTFICLSAASSSRMGPL
jgi:hypothetical protein